MPALPRGPRAKLDSDSLIKIVLLLVVIWLALALTKEFVETVRELLGPFDNLIGLLIVLVIVLWLLDRV
jgi:nitrogen fixation/metabolism regulation signal transduction histidine kinase